MSKFKRHWEVGSPLIFLKGSKDLIGKMLTHDKLTYSFVVWHVIHTCMRISLVKLSSRMWTNLRPILCTLRGCVMTEHILSKVPIFQSCCKSIFHSYAELMQLHLFLMTNLERELPDFWLEVTCTPTYNWEVRPFLQKWSGNNFFLPHLWLYCLHHIWNYQSRIDWQYHFRVESTPTKIQKFFFLKRNTAFWGVACCQNWISERE